MLLDKLGLRSKIMLPHIPAAREAAMVPIFAMSSKAPSPKAKPAMNNDIVKPIPLSQAAPKPASHENSGGAVARRDSMANRAKSKIPKGLPMNSTRTIPRLTGCRAAAATFPKIRTPEFAKAKSGMMAKLIQG
jgi:hypothetical protein